MYNMTFTSYIKILKTKLVLNLKMGFNFYLYIHIVVYCFAEVGAYLCNKSDEWA